LSRLQKEITAKSQDLAQKNAELEAYGHTIAHSLKTPLAAANRFLEILCKFESQGLSAEQRHLTEQARNALAMTGDVVDALLLLSTVAQQQVEVRRLDMGKLVGQALSQLDEMLVLQKARVQVPQTWPQAVGYEPWVGEVWLNLLSNALKYGGSPPQIEVVGTPSGSQARFSVRDNGQLLSEDERTRVFTPFTRLHQERAAGHGLGLATVQRIVSKLGGAVGVAAAPGGGNEFYFTLPTPTP
jgi:signal transduction histidine kinase